MASNELWMWAAIAALGLLALGASIAWLRHRASLADMQRRLAWSEESRFQLVQHAEAVDARLAELSEVLARQRQALRVARKAGAPSVAGAPDQPVAAPTPALRRPGFGPAGLMARAVAQAQASASRPPVAWADTEPQAQDPDPGPMQGFEPFEPFEPSGPSGSIARASARTSRPPRLSHPHPAWVADATTVPGALDPPLDRGAPPRG